MNIKVLCWNIRHGETNELYVDISAYIEEICQIEADVIILQEVDRRVRRSGSIDQVKALKEALGFRWSANFTPRMRIGGGEYGIATLSQFPIYRSTSHLLSDQFSEKCYAQEVELDVDGYPISVVNLHMPHDGHTGKCHAENAWNTLSQLELPRDLIIGGDLNALPDSPETDMLLMECTDIGELSTSIYGRIDYCMGRGRAVPVEQRVIFSELSDHLPFVTTFELKPFTPGEYNI